MLQFPLPTIAGVNGPALAGGFDLAVMCDLRIASTTARFAHPERAFGDVVYGPLHDLVGGAVARDLTLGGRELDARAALAVHLVNEVVEPAQLMDAVLATVARVCAAPRRDPDANEGEGAAPRRTRSGIRRPWSCSRGLPARVKSGKHRSGVWATSPCSRTRPSRTYSDSRTWTLSRFGGGGFRTVRSSRSSALSKRVHPRLLVRG